MAVCGVCSKERFLILRKYQGIIVKPERCLGCIVRFPPVGIEIGSKEFLKRRRWIKVLYHAWTLVEQSKKEDVWFCPYCRHTLISPKLGVPNSAGCPHGSTSRYRKTWNVDINRLSVVRCPLCDRKADIVTVKRLVVKRPRKSYFPYTCDRCYK